MLSTGHSGFLTQLLAEAIVDFKAHGEEIQADETRLE